MKAIMLSVKPEWIEKILNESKTIEIRKTKPSCELPVKVYIYCTNGKMLHDMKNEDYWTGNRFAMSDIKSNDIMQSSTPFVNRKVVAEFTLNKITDLNKLERIKRNGLIMYKGAMDMGQFNEYGGKYAWHIDDLKIYDEPKELSGFHTICNESNCLYCPYHYHENNASIGVEEFCMSDGLKPLTRPFQSWGYVEELEEV